MRKLLAFLFLVFLVQISKAQIDASPSPKLKTQLTVPVSISVSEINSLINRTVSGLIFEDDSFTDNNNDQFKVKVFKSSDIVLTALKDNRMLIEVPLKIWAVKGYGAFGHYVYQETEFGVKMKFISAISMNTDWKLVSNTSAAGFEWIVKPVLVFTKINIPIAPLVESSLVEQQKNFTGIIDRQISDSFDLKPYLLDIWNQFAMPLQLSEEFNTWLKLTPVSIGMTPVKLYSDWIKTTIGIDLYSESFVGKIPAPSPLIFNFPNYQKQDTLPADFNLQTTIQISYDTMTEIARKQFLGYEFEMTSKKNKVKIEDIILYPDKQSITMEIRTSGELNGTVLLNGYPYYDETSHQIKIKDTELHVKTKNLLQKTALLLFKGKIKRTIENDYGVPLKDIEDNSKKSLLENFNKEYHPGIFLSGRVLDLKPSQIFLFNNFITVVIDTKANLKLNIQELKF